MTENEQRLASEKCRTEASHPQTAIIANTNHNTQDHALAKADLTHTSAPPHTASDPQHHVEPQHVADAQHYQTAAGLVPVSVSVGQEHHDHPHNHSHNHNENVADAAVPVEALTPQDVNDAEAAVSGPLTGATTVPDPATLAVAAAAPEDAAAVIASVAAVNAVSAVPVSQVQPIDTTAGSGIAAQMVSVGLSAGMPSVSAAYAIHQPTATVPSAAQIPTGHLAPQMLAPNLVNMNVNMGAVNVVGTSAGLMPKDINGNVNTGRANMAMPMATNAPGATTGANMNVNSMNNIPPQRPITKRKSSGPFICEIVGCGKSFSKKFNLKAHRRVHTGEEPFRCSYPTCGKTFKWKSSLTFHEGLHLNVPDDPQPITANNVTSATVNTTTTTTTPTNSAPEQRLGVAAPGATTNSHAGVPGLVADSNKGKQEGKVQ